MCISMVVGGWDEVISAAVLTWQRYSSRDNLAHLNIESIHHDVSDSSLYAHGMLNCFLSMGECGLCLDLTENSSEC